MKPKVGDRFVCATSMSNFYTQGSIYDVAEDKGKLGFIGDDGIFDVFGKTTSRFVPLPVGEAKSE